MLNYYNSSQDSAKAGTSCAFWTVVIVSAHIDPWVTWKST
jgi:hypothetical protein